MDRSEVARPIIITLDGPNYIPWSQAMSSFLKGRKLWRYVTGDIKAPTQGAAKTPTEFIVRLEEWDISALDFPVPTETGPGQSISAFLPQIYSIWDQLTPSEPKWLCAGDSTLFATYRDQQRLILFLMGLSDIYEPVRASLLHRIPLSTLEQAISELLSEETRLGLISSSHVDTALAAPVFKGRGSFGGSRGFSTSGTQSSGSASQHNEGTFCHTTDHRLLTCPVRFCQYCRKKGPGHYKSDCPNNPTRRYTRPQSTAATVEVSSSASTPPTLIDVSDLPALVQQILSASVIPLLHYVDVPTALLDDASHDVSPLLVYPVESPSTDPAPSVAPPTHLPSDLPVRRSTRVREVPSHLRDLSLFFHCFSSI
ncbi:hypothetical protein Acr_18g0008600 [Actinidia rufa]|uniref:Retrotransposon Copia-like N-terminal domain-containing protein n=1 Tax=Actinidia rufa TaxID=165716 RepID=A0A7J0G7C5_9ERIC|nr:hypothetical protein Acr_18g0008600 [Actinidia rufa]